MKPISILLFSSAALLVAAAAPALAQPLQLRAGLWENSFALKTADGRAEAAMKEMQEQLAKMPPEQRKMMNDMMAKQGVSLGGQANQVRICMTQADVERSAPPPPEGDCTQTAKRNGNQWQISFQCMGPPPSSGEGQLSLLSPTSYEGQFKMRTVENGRPQEMQMKQSGRWLGADCGSIKPAPRK